jgi:hypothetical protein
MAGLHVHAVTSRAEMEERGEREMISFLSMVLQSENFWKSPAV